MTEYRCSIGGERIPADARIGSMSDVKAKNADCAHTNMGLVCAAHISQYRLIISQITGDDRINAGSVNKFLKRHIPQM